MESITALYIRGNLNYDLYGIGVVAGNAGRKLPLGTIGPGFSGGCFATREYDSGGSRIELRSTSGADRPEPPPDFGLNTTLIALGLRLDRETTSNRFYPTGGTLLDFTADFFSEVLGSKYSFQAYRFTFNKYGSLSKNQVLAYNLFICGTGGEPRFYGSCVYGANNQLRGYTAGRYLDRYMRYSTGVPLELAKRDSGSLALAESGKYFRVVPQIFRANNFLPAGGGGLRFQLSKAYRVNLRADIAKGKNSWTWSMGVGEAF